MRETLENKQRITGEEQTQKNATIKRETVENKQRITGKEQAQKNSRMKRKITGEK